MAESPDDDPDNLFVLPEGVARGGASIHGPADAADALVRHYEEIRSAIGDPYGEEDDEFAEKMREYAVPLEEDLMMYMHNLAEALRTTADNTMKTARNFAVTEEENAGIANMANPDGPRGGGSGGRR